MGSHVIMGRSQHLAKVSLTWKVFTTRIPAQAPFHLFEMPRSRCRNFSENQIFDFHARRDAALKQEVAAEIFIAVALYMLHFIDDLQDQEFKFQRSFS